MKKVLYFLSFVFCVVACNAYGQSNASMFKIEKTTNLTIFHTDNQPGLVITDDPWVTNGNICVPAAYTSVKTIGVQPGDVVGNYFDSDGEKGVVSKGAASRDVNGVFWTTPTGFHFDISDIPGKLKMASLNHGIAFQQTMLLYKSKNVCPQNCKPVAGTAVRRCLAKKGNMLLIIQSNSKMTIEDFINSLLKLGVTDAINLQMGKDWDFMYYTNSKSEIKTYSPVRHQYYSNFLVF